MSKLRTLTTRLAALLLAPGLAAAQGATDATGATGDAETPRRYAVEIILFRYADTVSSGNEVFVPDPPPELPTLDDLPPSFGLPGGNDDDGPSFGDARVQGTAPGEAGEVEPGPAESEPEPEPEPEPGFIDEPLEEIILPTQRVELAMTPREELTLGDTWDKLELLDAYEPVLWGGWSQLVMERNGTPTIPLRRVGNAPPDFDGKLQLYLSRFLHLVVDLSLTPRQPGVTVDEGPRFGDRRQGFEPWQDRRRGIVRLRIDEDRIVRNGDLRYFDHPRFGLLAKVTRIEEPESPDDDAPGETLPANGGDAAPAR